MTEVKKAVFPVAGFGTRFLPATKAMPKELMPIVNKPLIQYAAEEAVLAGIETLIFVTGRNKRAIEDHFDQNKDLQSALELCGNYEMAEKVRNTLPDGVDCVFVRQAEQLGLGHAILRAEKVVGNEPFAVILADDFIPILNEGVTKRLIDSYKENLAPQLAAIKVPKSEISKYGVISFNDQTGCVSGLTEKPKTEEALSDLASIGRYILNPNIFDILKNIKPGVGGEIQLADAIDLQAKAERVEMSIIDENRFDCGSLRGFVEATLHVAKIDGLLE
ncbi:MAG: UTP--glucose-1-phosphate uridylyltransferase [Candidatus Endolissoclinum sp. TMED37]|nr:MAG: UTP--glucose-1-phosphate uridylyltransferase [Candidatus Endolissoclinum sp. TMED37]|tara:strand:+ start:1768 stop:2595 length:828 start_codon:yes stop_codon:yes gene_type:complete